MCNRQQCIARLKEAEPYLRKEFGGESLRLFGSMARGDNRADSDIDLYVDMPPKGFKVIGLKIFLQELLGTAVDIVRRTSNIDTFLANEIARDGITIFA